MNRIARLLATATAFLAVAGCSRLGLGVKGDGVIKTEDRPVADFSRIEVSGACEVIWAHGKPALSVATDQNILPHITTAVTGQTLRIAPVGSIAPSQGIVIVLSSDALTEAHVTGAVTLKARQVTAEELKLEATGASTIVVDGAVTRLDANLTGASALAAHSLPAKSAVVSLTGASNADVTVSDALNASVTGAGSLTYSGNPKSVEKTVTGAGNVRPRP